MVRPVAARCGGGSVAAPAGPGDGKRDIYMTTPEQCCCCCLSQRWGIIAWHCRPADEQPRRCKHTAELAGGGGGAPHGAPRSLRRLCASHLLHVCFLPPASPKHAGDADSGRHCLAPWRGLAARCLRSLRSDRCTEAARLPRGSCSNHRGAAAPGHTRLATTQTGWIGRSCHSPQHHAA